MVKSYSPMEEIPIGDLVDFRCKDGQLFDSNAFNRTRYWTKCLFGNIWSYENGMLNDSCINSYYCHPVQHRVSSFICTNKCIKSYCARHQAYERLQKKGVFKRAVFLNLG